MDPYARFCGRTAPENGASYPTIPAVGCDRRATQQMARRRPAPTGWGDLARWRCCTLLTDRLGMLVARA